MHVKKINIISTLSYAEPPWAQLFLSSKSDENKLETGFREGEKLQKGDRKMRKAKRGW
jgi:hypothetical protein